MSTAFRRPSVSLVLPNRNNGPVLDLTLRRLEVNTTYPDFELVVVDDESTDGSLPILRRWRDSGRFRSFQLLETAHSGVADSLNQGVSRSSGELVVSLDGDATLETRGWLERLVALHQLDPRVGVVTAGIVMDTGRIHGYGFNMISAEGMHDRGSRITQPAGHRTLEGALEHFRAPWDVRTAEVDAGIGCCMLYARDLWSELGGYDTRFWPVWFEDLDLSLSVRRLGLKVFAMPQVKVLHRMSLRNSRYGDRTRVVSAALAVRRGVGRVAPQVVKDVVVHRRRRNDVVPEAIERTRRHLGVWREKWGFDALNPDMDGVLARYGDSEVGWAYDEGRRQAGAQILARYASLTTLPDSSAALA